ncbi:MAG: DUF1211 domain-containing protein [Candidatus Omnitrophica bacterium]|nr:DUF1211 domain-containing protein [Candidatus Omnitrophota bacterium]MBI3010366.1 DUF1211 domain-containing protein [Candidatus Omnitrophota bacterium]
MKLFEASVTLIPSNMSAKNSPGRVEAFSDGVLAIVITLLVLEIKVPHLYDPLSQQEAGRALQVLFPKFASFILSFAYVAVFWVNHHHFFHWIEHATPGLIWLNNLLLLFLCFIPFPTAFVGDYPANPIGLVLFAMALMGAGLVFTLMWHHAYRWKLIDPSMPERVAKQAVSRGLIGPPLYAIAAMSAFAMPWITWLIFCMVPAYFFFHSIRTLTSMRGIDAL